MPVRRFYRSTKYLLYLSSRNARDAIHHFSLHMLQHQNNNKIKRREQGLNELVQKYKSFDKAGICRVLLSETANRWLLLLAGAAEQEGSAAASQLAVLLDGRSGRRQGRGTSPAEWETR